MKKTEEEFSPKTVAILFVIAIGIALFIYFIKTNSESDLAVNGLKGKAIITERQHRTSRGDFMVYQFYFMGRKYEGSERWDQSYSVGDTIDIVFSSKDPQNNQIEEP